MTGRVGWDGMGDIGNGIGGDWSEIRIRMGQDGARLGLGWIEIGIRMGLWYP